jgi:penicillin-binding protein activator
MTPLDGCEKLSGRMRLGLALLLLATACGTTTPPKEIARTDVAYDLSGEWNDVDADLVARAMIDECLKSQWAEQWAAAHGGKKPVLRLYPILNRTTAYIDYRYFTKQIEAALVASGRLDVVAGTAVEADPEAPPPEAPADFQLTGSILSQEDTDGQRELRAYLTSIEIIETATQKKAWVGQKRIRKLIQQR